MLTINFNPFPEINTPRLLLREISEKDVNEVFFLRSNEEVLKYINKPPAKTINDALDFIGRVTKLKEEGLGINWSITLKGNNKLIGNICIFNIKPEHHRGEVGYVLHPQYWNKGIMQESLTAVLDFGFRKMKLHSLEANINPANEASIKLLERNNFIREAYFRENYFFENKFLDSIIYSLLTPLKENHQ